jgi:hypothetical protein
LTTTTGALQNVMGTGSRKIWTYFTSDNSAPDGNQPHNAVTQIAPGDGIRASISFMLPNGATSATTGKDFRFGLFWDPTDARVQIDTNNDSGGAALPWGDAVGYMVQMPLNATSSGANPFQLGKRTSSANTGLVSSNSSYTLAPTGGVPFALAEDVVYTAELEINMISPTQSLVSIALKQGATVLSAYSTFDNGANFGGTAIVGALPGNTLPYVNFDQLMWRHSSNVQASQIDLTNFKIEAIPEPGSIGLIAVAMMGLTRRRRQQV